jgi:TonB family protein
MGKKKILVIDYDQASLSALEQILTHEGFNVVLAGDGQVGWEKFQSEKPDLVLMEAMLSKIHGFELCDRITKDPVRKVPVFIMTGVYKDRVYRTEALRTYGASEYFEKPLDMLKFIASIHGVLTLPDIKPEKREAEPPKAVPLIKPVKEEPRRPEPPPEVHPAKEETPRPRPSGNEWGGGLETVHQAAPAREQARRVEPAPEPRPAKEAPPKIRVVPDGKGPKDGEIRLETLLNLTPEKKEEHRRPESSKPLIPSLDALRDLGPKPHEHARKEPETEDIDELLKETLADFGLEHEKKKTFKASPPPPPAPAPVKPKVEPMPPPPPPAPQKPKAVAPPEPPAYVAPEKAKPAPPPPMPAAVAEKPKAVAPPAPPATPPPMPAAVAEKPKFTPPKPEPAQPTSRPRFSPPPVAPLPPAPAPKPQLKPEPKPEPRPEPRTEARVEPRPEPRHAEKPEKKETPARPAEHKKEAEPRMFKDIYEIDKKKSSAPAITVGAAIVVVAAVGFFLLRPKHPGRMADLSSRNPVTLTQSSVPETTADTTVPPLPEEKLKAVNPKPKAAPVNQNRQQEALPGAEEAIIPAQPADLARLRLQTPAQKKPAAKPSDTKTSDAKPAEAGAGEVKSGETQGTSGQQQPPVKTEAPPPATQTQGTAVRNDEVVAAPLVAKANPGDLVDLAAVDEQPKIVKSVEPVYPTQALRFGKEGSVTVNALIDESGDVVETAILRGLLDDMGLEKAAEAAVKKWKFQPAKKDGVTVKVWKPITINFKTGRGTRAGEPE